MSFLVTMVWALLATASKMGQMAIVSSATRITGANDVMVEAAFGLASSQACNAGMKPPIVVREVSVQKKETGKIWDNQLRTPPER